MRWLDHITKSMDMSLSKFKKTVKDTGAWSDIVHGVRHDLATEQQRAPGIIIKQSQEGVPTIVNVGMLVAFKGMGRDSHCRGHGRL